MVPPEMSFKKFRERFIGSMEVNKKYELPMFFAEEQVRVRELKEKGKVVGYYWVVKDQPSFYIASQDNKGALKTFKSVEEAKDDLAKHFRVYWTHFDLLAE